MNDTQYRPSNFVVAEPEAIPRADLVRRGDVVDQVGRLIDVYQEQQRAALAGVQQDVGRNGYLSSADAVAERRKTSRLYLLTYFGVSGLTVAGLVVLAAIGGVLNTPGALAVWLTLTGITTLTLAWVRHGDEFKHSPEGIARHVVDAHWDLSAYEAETRRKSLAWEYHAEARRQQAAAQASADARQQAAMRLEEIDARRRMNEARFQPPMMPEISQLSNAEPEPTPSTWQRDLLAWVGELYAGDGMTTDGVVRVRVPWAARSPWVDADKAAAKELCTVGRPRFLLPAPGQQWRVNLELFPTADVAVQYLSGRMR